MRLSTFIAVSAVGLFISVAALPATSASSGEFLTLLDGSSSESTGTPTDSIDNNDDSGSVDSSAEISLDSMDTTTFDAGADATMTLSNAASLPTGQSNATQGEDCSESEDPSVLRRANGTHAGNIASGICRPLKPSGKGGKSAGINGSGGSGGGATVTVTVTVTEEAADAEETDLASFASGDDASFVGTATSTLDASDSEETSISDTTGSSTDNSSDEGSDDTSTTSRSDSSDLSDESRARLARIRRRVARERDSSRKLRARRF